MVSAFYRKMVIPAFEAGLKRRRSFQYWRDLQGSQWLEPQQLHAGQLEKLTRLLAHARANCAFYGELCRRHTICEERIESLRQFEDWPLLTREVITQNRDSLCARGTAGGLIAKATGGSSGTPLKFFLDVDSNDRRMAAWHRGYDWAGAGPGTRQLYLWGVPLVDQNRRQQWKDYLYNRWIYRRRIENSFQLSAETVPQFVRILNRFRPDSLVAYTNPIYFVARTMDELGVQPFSPKSIVVGAEKLHDFQREVIERVFRAPVFETYGSREFMLIGAECERHSGLHLTMENLLVEIVDDAGRPMRAGEEGNVVITDLFNYGMPFIRYVTGDRAVAGFEKCSCGRGLLLLRKVVGRQLDILTTAGGRKIPGEFFPHLLKDYEPIRKFQVVQTAQGTINLKIVAAGGWSETMREELETRIRRTIGDETTLNIVNVDAIPLTAAGKLQVVVNEIGAGAT